MLLNIIEVAISKKSFSWFLAVCFSLVDKWGHFLDIISFTFLSTLVLSSIIKVF